MMVDEPTAPPTTRPASLRELMEQVKTGGTERPVEQWDPPFRGDLDMRIARDGSWHYCGSLIQREAMVRLFASVLRRESDGSYSLVTPGERWCIVVEDVPFVTVDFEVTETAEGTCLVFTTNVGDRVVAGADHPLRFERLDTVDGMVVPYIRVRGGLDARVGRKCFYRLVELAEPECVAGEAWLGVRSGGEFFRLMQQAESET